MKHNYHLLLIHHYNIKKGCDNYLYPLIHINSSYPITFAITLYLPFVCNLFLHCWILNYKKPLLSFLFSPITFKLFVYLFFVCSLITLQRYILYLYLSSISTLINLNSILIYVNLTNCKQISDFSYNFKIFFLYICNKMIHFCLIFLQIDICLKWC